MLSFTGKILTKTCGTVNDFCPKTDTRITQQELEKVNTGILFGKVANNYFDPMHSRKRSATIVSNCR